MLATLNIYNPSEEYLIEMFLKRWDVCEDQSSGVKRERIDYFIKLIRQKLMTMSPNGQEEFTLRNIFRNFDSNQDGVLTIRELEGLSSKLGVAMNPNEMQAVFDRIDSNKNGMLEFEEFAKHLLEDPYTK